MLASSMQCAWLSKGVLAQARYCFSTVATNTTSLPEEPPATELKCELLRVTDPSQPPRSPRALVSVQLLIPMRVFAALRAAQHRELTLTQIFLVGTAHVSKASVEEVRSTIRRVRPGDGAGGARCGPSPKPAQRRSDVRRRNAQGVIPYQ